MKLTYEEAIRQRNIAIKALKSIVKMRNVFRMWEVAYAALTESSKGRKHEGS